MTKRKSKLLKSTVYHLHQIHTVYKIFDKQISWIHSCHVWANNSLDDLLPIWNMPMCDQHIQTVWDHWLDILGVVMLAWRARHLGQSNKGYHLQTHQIHKTLVVMNYWNLKNYFWLITLFVIMENYQTKQNCFGIM